VTCEVAAVGLPVVAAQPVGAGRRLLHAVVKHPSHTDVIITLTGIAPPD